MAEGPTSHAATANCPMLCVIPPATLTPKAEMCKRFLFFNKFMIIRLSTLPGIKLGLANLVIVLVLYKNSKFSDCVDVRFHISLLFDIIVQ